MALHAISKPAKSAASFEWTSDNPGIASVTADGVVTGVSVGETHICAKLDGKLASCQVRVCPVPNAVDLGLGGTKWASFNIGASNENEPGQPFKWAGVVPIDMNPETPYIETVNQDGPPMRFATKYCLNSEYGLDGYSDLLSILEAQDDAATQILGAGWRTPTRSEYTQLFQACTWTWVANKNCFKISNKLESSKYIYLTVTGHPNGAFDQQKGYYWTCNVDKNDPTSAYSYQIAHVSDVITSDLHTIVSSSRMGTYYIRAVREY